jgi:hypothetical protein
MRFLGVFTEWTAIQLDLLKNIHSLGIKG